MKVYLCGGFYGNWKNEIKDSVGDCDFYDPEKDTSQKSISDYTKEDIEAIDDCDLLFAYLGNYPVYGGLAAEIGYAYCKGIPIILVSDKDEVDGFLVGLSRWYCTNLQAGIKRLGKVIH